jgi:hypothetical protein
MLKALRLPATLLLALVGALLAPKSSADTLTFQQGVGGYTGLKQTTLFEFAPTSVNGGLAAGTWTVDEGDAVNDNRTKQGLIWFDNIFGSSPGQIPFGSTITEATITATYDDPSSSGFAVHRMLQTWSPATATWDTFTAGVQSDGTEAAVVATTTFSNPNLNTSGNYNAYGTSLTADLQLFSNGTPNYGWVVVPTSGTSGWGWTVAQTNSAVLSVTFTPPASVLSATITGPANSSTVGQNFTITATASTVSPATVTSVTFKDGATVLGVDTTSPYSWGVTGAALGTHTLTAMVTDSNSATATSAPVNVTVVNLAPTVSIASPANGASVGTSFTISANAADPDGTVSSVAFYDGATLLGTDTASPYTWSVTGAAVGNHALTVVATDNNSASTTSAVVNVAVAVPILIGPAGSGVQTFGTAPPTIQWSTLSLSGGPGDVSSGSGIDTAMSTIAASSITTALGSQSGSGTSGNAYWRSGDQKLGTQPTGNKMTLLMARLQNDSGGTIAGLTVAYNLGVALTPAEEIKGHRVYWSKTGAAGTWTAAGDFLQATPGTTAVSFNIPSLAWANGDSLYIVWTDDNGTTNPDGDFTIDDVNFTITGPQPPTVAITNPANGATVFTTFTIDAIAADSDGAITSVAFYDGATLLFTDTTSPYSYTWTGASVGAHMLTAVALDNSSTSTTSTTVNVTVSANSPPVVTLTSPADLANITTTSTMLTANIADPEGAAQTVTFYGRERAPINPGPDFTLIAIPDTQFYSENTGRNPGAPSNSGANISFFNDITDWITANRVSRNIPFVAHMGDMVQNVDSIDAEWVRADGAMWRIENPLTTMLTHGIPWGGAPGNHDYSASTGVAVKWNEYFGTARWAGRPYFGGNYGTNNNNNYQFFKASGLDFLVINLGYRTSTFDIAVHDWADALMKAHPSHRVILTSHWIIGTGHPASFGGQGQALYDNLKDNPNFFLMLCGHIHGDGRRSDVFEGRTIYTVLSDFQSVFNGGNGFLRTLVFSPANNRITSEMYSPTLNRLATTADTATYQGTYAMDYNMQGSVMNWTPLGTVNIPASGTSASLNWAGLQTGKTYEWYAVSNDGVFLASSSARRFITPIGTPPTVAITSPANNTTYFAPFTVNITATAGDTDGTVTKVEFYRGATKIGEDTSAPYESTASGLGIGSYALTAVATDNLGNFTTSAVVTVSATTLDSDSDGIPDSYETTHGLNSANAADAVLDKDGDGVSNRDEFIFGTAASVSDRYAYSAAYNSPAGTTTVTFATSTGRTYSVYYRNSLEAGTWQAASGVVTGTGAAMQWTDDGTVTGSLPSAAGKRFYRIEATVVP